VQALKPFFRCVRFTLPGFDLEKPPRATSLAQMTALLTDIVDAVSPARPVHLLLHDWGVSLAMNSRRRVRSGSRAS